MANRRYRSALEKTRAGAVVVSREYAESFRQLTLLIADDPYFTFREAMVALRGFRKQPPPGISDLAYVHPDASIGVDCAIEPFAYISAGAVIGDRCVVHPHCFLGPNTKVGDDCIFYPNVTIYDDCTVGNRVILQAGCVIGQDGFGYATHATPNQPLAHHKIPQVGNVVIEDDVEMGANCSIDRGTLGSTRIGAGTKFSDLIAIGHGTQIGKHNLFVAQCGIAGSTVIGDYVILGGQVGIAGHLKIGDGVQLAAKSCVLSNIEAGQQYGGIPAEPIMTWKRSLPQLQLARTSQLSDKLRETQEQLVQLQARLDALEKKS